jgi:excisionase family DNA binding protein
MKTFTVSSDDLESLRLLLPDADALETPNDKPASASSLTPQVLELLNYLAHEFSQGRSVTVASSEIRLTTQEAADLTGVSRPTLIKLLDEYAIPYDTVGRHRRIRFDDLRILQARYVDSQREKGKAMIEASQSAGEYAADPSDNPLIR